MAGRSFLLLLPGYRCAPPLPNLANDAITRTPCNSEAVARLEWKSVQGTGDQWQLVPSARLFYDVVRVAHPLSIL